MLQREGIFSCVIEEELAKSMILKQVISKKH